MKNTIKLLLVSLFVFLTSCITETDNPRIDYDFEIANSSGENIKILAFRDDILMKETRIPNNKIYFESFSSSAADQGYNFRDVLGGDSIKVIYGNEKIEFFKCYRFINQDEGCEKPRNILSVFQDNDDNDRIFLNQYTFTESDYENAEDCDGICE